MSALTLTIDVTPESATLAKVQQRQGDASASTAPSPVPLEELGNLGEVQQASTGFKEVFEPLPLEELEALTGSTHTPMPEPISPEELEALTDDPRPEENF